MTLLPDATSRPLPSMGFQFSIHGLLFTLTPEAHVRLMEACLKLRCWPDVPAALSSLNATPQ